MIWVISDRPEEAWGLLTLAQGLRKKPYSLVTAYVTGSQAEGELALAYGADRVRLLEMPAQTGWEQYVWVLGEEALGVNPGLILVSGTPRGQTLAAQLAALLDCPLLSQCHVITRGEKGKICAERFTLGGRCIEKITAFNRTVVITVPLRTFQAGKCAQPGQGEIKKMPAPTAAAPVLQERIAAPRPKVELEKAPVVVGVGRGFGNKDRLVLAEQLAEILGGAVACSRSVAEDLHWMPADLYLGITGKTVKPDLYLALGISGQPQHIYGVRDARLIVAVNNNDSALIAGEADYFIHADLQQFLPVLLEELAAWLQES